MTIEEKLRQMITDRYGSVAKFADECGIKYQTMMSILNRGINNASINNIIKICQTLSISADALAESRIVHVNKNKAPFRFEDTISNISAGSTTINTIPLTEDEAQFLIDMISVSIEMIKKKRTRQTP